MLFTFLVFSRCRTSESEYIIYNYKKHNNPESSLKFVHKPYGFISYYSGDNSDFTEFHKLFVLGNNCLRLAPHIDRILIIPTDFYVSNSKMHHLATVWNIILRMRNIEPRCSYEINGDAKQMWFRLRMFTLTMYKKLLFVGHNIIFVKDPEPIFAYNTPSAPIDYQSYGYTYFGIAHNFDFFLFSPSESTYQEILNMSCRWIQLPFIRQEKFYSISAAQIGPYDNGLLHEYLGKDVWTMQPYLNIEIGPESFYNKLHYSDERIMSYRFSESNPPWKGTTFADITWRVIAEEAFAERGIHFHPMLKPKLSESENRRVIKNKLRAIEIPVFKNIECNNDFVSFSGKSVLIRSIALFVGGFGIIEFIITKNYKQDPDDSDIVFF